jgi:MerR family transcriptional regulator/heat shock protein HspR
MAKSDAVYVISVAAELAGMHAQTLRMYERKGLLHPQRTPGRTRRYSAADIERLRRIQSLTQQYGVNLAGARMILDLEDQLAVARRRLGRMAERLEEIEISFTRREPLSILPASAYRSLEDMWKEVRARGAGAYRP